MNRSDLEDARNAIDDAETLMNDLINLFGLNSRADADDIRDAVEALIQEKADLAERLDAILDERDGLVIQIDELTAERDDLDYRLSELTFLTS